MTTRTLDTATCKLSSKPPSVSTTVTACGGSHRYRVLAYRPLSYEEVVDAISVALDRDWLAVPGSGEESVLYTSIGAVPADVRRAAPPARAVALR